MPRYTIYNDTSDGEVFKSTSNPSSDKSNEALFYIIENIYNFDCRLCHIKECAEWNELKKRLM